MIFKNLLLYNFKIFETLELNFSEGLNFFIGHNGTGKTSVLDALYYLSMTKSSINTIDNSNIKFNENNFLIKSKIQLEKKEHIVSCSIKLGKKKEIKVNKKEHEKLSQHIGLFPSVMISPNDGYLIYDSSESRRKFFDAAICQSDKKYLQHLIAYNFALKNRNYLLKQNRSLGNYNNELLEIYTNQLIENGTPIYSYRKQYLFEFLKLFNIHFSSLQSKNEEVSIEYESHFEKKNIESLFKDTLQKDLHRQRTCIGIHRDTFSFTIYNKPLKRHGSQGQQKSFLVALKLAQYDLLLKQKKIKPVLLLDDIFDKLDDERVNKLLKKVATKNYKQLFITDARPERTMKVLEKNQLAARIFELEKGAILKTTNYEAKK